MNVARNKITYIQSNAELAIKPAKEPSLFLFDFCGTIFNCNTTLHFLNYLSKLGNIKHKLSNLILWLLASLLCRLKVISPLNYMNIRLKALKGIKKGFLSSASESFFADYLVKYEMTNVLEFLKTQVVEGKKVIIVSYSLDIIIYPFLQKHNVQKAICSQLEFNSNQMCTGSYKIQLEQKGKINALLQDYAMSEIENAFFITDDLNADLDLISRVAHPYVYTNNNFA